MTTTAKAAIARSESHDEIVTIDYDAEAFDALKAASSDYVHANGVTEFWANDPDSETGMLWRVHMRDAKSTAISDELTAGIAQYQRRIAPLLGTRVTVRMPDGVQRTGTFSDRNVQPMLTDDDGRVFAIPADELDRLA